MTRVVKNEEKPEPTQLEIDISKSERRVSDMKHMDAIPLAMQEIYPLLRKLAAGLGDLEEGVDDNSEDIASLQQAIDAGALGVDGETSVNALQVALDCILEMGVLLDETMVVAGFYQRQRDETLQATKKVPLKLKAAYERLSENVGTSIGIMQVAIAAAAQADAVDEDVDGDGHADAAEDAGEIARAAAEEALAKATSDATSDAAAAADGAANVAAKEGGSDATA